MTTRDGWSQVSPTFVLQLRIYPGKNLNQENWPARWETTMLPLDHSGCLCIKCIIYFCCLQQNSDIYFCQAMCNTMLTDSFVKLYVSLWAVPLSRTCRLADCSERWGGVQVLQMQQQLGCSDSSPYHLCRSKQVAISHCYVLCLVLCSFYCAKNIFLTTVLSYC